MIEVTLLGQNVNTYGVEFGDRGAFADLLRACGAVRGLERVRFTSPHPAAFTDDVIAAMAETPTVMPQLHMPLQSGSDRVLRAMRRSYRAQRFLGILDRVRAAIPDAAISTDVIVGFPGETEEDFAATLDVVGRRAVRPGVHVPVLAAARHPGRDAGRTRCPRPSSRSATSGWSRCRRRSPGRRTARRRAATLEVLVAEGEGRKDGATRRLSGRAPDNRLVHFAVPDGGEVPRPGDVATVRVTYGAPHHLVADAALAGRPVRRPAHRRRRRLGPPAGRLLRCPGAARGRPRSAPAGGAGAPRGPGLILRVSLRRDLPPLVFRRSAALSRLLRYLRPLRRASGPRRVRPKVSGGPRTT